MDTDTLTRSRHVEVYRGMTPAQRVELAIEMSEELRAITMAAMRFRNPSLTDRGALNALVEALYGVRIGTARDPDVAC
ncbi:MAG: hypothetical protein ACSLFB_01470 [Acidimicrobiales bacterium]